MKTFTLKQLFSLVDGRLSTDIGDVYEMLNHICNENLYTHHLPVAMKFIKQLSPIPDWYTAAESEIAAAKNIVGDDFKNLMDYINQHNTSYEITQLSGETLKGFIPYMMDNSLLLKKAYKA